MARRAAWRCSAALAERIDPNALRLRTAADLQAWENGTERPPAYYHGIGVLPRCEAPAPQTRSVAIPQEISA
ncbi:MAG: hypothetical protein ACREUI_06885, partial [Burkholderiales bacterium]